MFKNIQGFHCIAAYGVVSVLLHLIWPQLSTQ